MSNTVTPQIRTDAPTPAPGPSPAPPRRNRVTGERRRVRWWHLALIPLCLVWIYPFLWMVSASFKSQKEMLLGGLSLWPKQWTLDNFSRAWAVGRFGDYTINTLIFSAAVVIIMILVSALAGYALSDKNLPGRKTIVGVIVAMMFIPSGYSIIPTFQLVNAIGLQQGLLGAALAQVGPGLTIPVLLYLGFFSGIPKELNEAAQLDGAGYLRSFFSVMLPLASPVTGTVALMTFIGAWNAFLVPLVFTLGQPNLRTLGVGMYNFFGTDTTDWTGLAAGATISIIPIVIVFLFLQKTFVEGISGAVKS
ncbi:MAG TPA: carbohydrate ABC transporter permease [Streptosporangiaceae bacterium]|jgi:raffinose/stachyose/melibiose transport system permease protein|nr:carbohydrate ABC transporter permease [Streptosporangiaceae bacterium]